MSTTSKTILIIAIVLMVGAFFLYPRLVSDDTVAPVATTSPAPNLMVEAIVIETEILNNDLRVTGSLIANETVTLSPEVAGRVERINFKEGQRVKKGQLLIRLNDDELLAELDKLNFTKKLNEDIEYRQKQLLAREAISKEEYETSLTTLNTTLADIRVKQVQLQKHQIRAPFDGIIGLRSVSEGSFVSPSDDLVTLYSINPIKIDLTIPGKYAAEVNPDDKITFTVDAYDDRQFEGSIYATEPQIDPQTRSMKIRALSSNKDGLLLPGQFAKITLTINSYDEAIMIPTEAVIPELNGKKVFVRENGVVASKAIETGIRTSDQVQVTAGLTEGDTVITTGVLQLRPGMPVDVNLKAAK